MDFFRILVSVNVENCIEFTLKCGFMSDFSRMWRWSGAHSECMVVFRLSHKVNITLE